MKFSKFGYWSIFLVIILLLELKLIENQYLLHFIAGLYMPAIYNILCVALIKFYYKVTHTIIAKSNDFSSVEIGAFIYIVQCIYWETWQASQYSRILQFDQLCIDIIGIGVYIGLKRKKLL